MNYLKKINFKEKLKKFNKLKNPRKAIDDYLDECIIKIKTKTGILIDRDVLFEMGAEEARKFMKKHPKTVKALARVQDPIHGLEEDLTDENIDKAIDGKKKRRAEYYAKQNE